MCDRWCRDGLLKMQDVFSKNPKMGDPASLAPQLDENSRTLDQLQQEIRKYEASNSFVCSLLPVKARNNNQITSNTIFCRDMPQWPCPLRKGSVTTTGSTGEGSNHKSDCGIVYQ